MSKQDKPVACKHPQIIAYAIADEGPEHGQPAGLWGCAVCNRKFVPLDLAPPVAELPALPHPSITTAMVRPENEPRKLWGAYFTCDDMRDYARTAVAVDRAAQDEAHAAEIAVLTDALGNSGNRHVYEAPPGMVFVEQGTIETHAAALATLARLGYTYEGGEQWKPPLGKKPDFDLIDSLRAENERLTAERDALRADRLMIALIAAHNAVEACASATGQRRAIALFVNKVDIANEATAAIDAARTGSKP